MATVADFMTVDLRWAVVGDTVQEAARLMREQSVGFLPVCERAGGRVVAVITDRDIATRLCAFDRQASRTAVFEVATRPPIVCRPGTDVRDAEALMKYHQILRLVVVDDDQHPVGVVSLTDLFENESPLRAVPPNPVAEDEHLHSGPVQERQDVITGGRLHRSIKEFPG